MTDPVEVLQQEAARQQELKQEDARARKATQLALKHINTDLLVHELAQRGISQMELLAKDIAFAEKLHKTVDALEAETPREVRIESRTVYELSGYWLNHDRAKWIETYQLATGEEWR